MTINNTPSPRLSGSLLTVHGALPADCINKDFLTLGALYQPMGTCRATSPAVARRKAPREWKDASWKLTVMAQTAAANARGRSGRPENTSPMASMSPRTWGLSPNGNGFFISANHSASPALGRLATWSYLSHSLNTSGSYLGLS